MSSQTFTTNVEDTIDRVERIEYVITSIKASNSLTEDEFRLVEAALRAVGLMMYYNIINPEILNRLDREK